MNVLITCYYLVLFIYVLLLLIPVTSAWGLSELWGGGISTPDISHSSPRLRRLTLHFILALPSHLFLISFLDCCPPPPLFSTAPPSAALHSQITLSLPPLPVQISAPPGRRLHPPPTSLRRSSLRLAPRACVCCHSRAGALPPCPPLYCTHFPDGTCVFRVLCFPMCLCVPDYPSPSSPPNLFIYIMRQ